MIKDKVKMNPQVHSLLQKQGDVQSNGSTTG